MVRGRVLTGGVAFFCALLMSSVPSEAARSRQTVILGPNDSVAIAGTRIICQGSRTAELLCSVAASDDPTDGGYDAAVAADQSLFVAEFSVLGPRVVYTHGSKLPSAFASGTPHTVHAGEIILLRGSTVGCTVGSSLVRCASTLARNGSPRRGSYGFVLRNNASITTYRFDRHKQQLFSGAAAKVLTHAHLTLNLGDSFGLFQTGEICTDAIVQNVDTLVCIIASSGTAVDGTYAVGVQAGGGIFVGRFSNGVFSNVYTHQLGAPSPPPPPAPPPGQQQVLSAQPGDSVAVNGTSIGCHISRVFNDNQQQVDLVFCGTNFGAGQLVSGAYLVMLDHLGQAEVLRVTADKKLDVVATYSP